MTARDEAIRELYRVFGSLELGDGFTGCSHCIDPKEVTRLSDTPRDELSRSDLDSYAFDALSTFGDVASLKYFLPRLLELTLEDPQGWTSLEVLIGKLAHGSWTSWPAEEQEAVTGALHVLWDATLSADTTAVGGWEVDTVLCALGQALESIMPMLDRWTRTDTETARRHLAQWIELNGPVIADGRGPHNGFWKGRPQQEAEVIAWLKRPSTLDYLEAGTGRVIQEAAWQLVELW